MQHPSNSTSGIPLPFYIVLMEFNYSGIPLSRPRLHTGALHMSRKWDGIASKLNRKFVASKCKFSVEWKWSCRFMLHFSPCMYVRSFSTYIRTCTHAHAYNYIHVHNIMQSVVGRAWEKNPSGYICMWPLHFKWASFMFSRCTQRTPLTYIRIKSPLSSSVGLTSLQSCPLLYRDTSLNCYIQSHDNLSCHPSFVGI